MHVHEPSGTVIFFFTDTFFCHSLSSCLFCCHSFSPTNSAGNIVCVAWFPALHAYSPRVRLWTDCSREMWSILCCMNIVLWHFWKLDIMCCVAVILDIKLKKCSGRLQILRNYTKYMHCPLFSCQMILSTMSILEGKQYRKNQTRWLKRHLGL